MSRKQNAGCLFRKEIEKDLEFLFGEGIQEKRSNKKIHPVARILHRLTKEIKEDERTIPITDKVQEAYSKLIEIAKKDGYEKPPVHWKNMFIGTIMSYIYYDYVSLESKKILDTCHDKYLLPEEISKILPREIRDIISKLDIEEKIFEEVLRKTINRFQYLVLDKLGLVYRNKQLVYIY